MGSDLCQNHIVNNAEEQKGNQDFIFSNPNPRSKQYRDGDFFFPVCFLMDIVIESVEQNTNWIKYLKILNDVHIDHPLITWKVMLCKFLREKEMWIIEYSELQSLNFYFSSHIARVFMQVFFVHSFRAYFVQVFFLAGLLLCIEANSSKRVGNLETKI